MGESVVLKPGTTSLATLEGLYRDSPAAALDPGCRPKVERAAAVIGQAAAGLLACLVPGARAASTDPVKLLRSE